MSFAPQLIQKITRACLPALSMACMVALSNYLVLFPINDWLTWGALSYPLTYFVNELTNRLQGTKSARWAVYVGLVVALMISWQISTPQVTLASGSAFFVSQMLDISIFDHLRRGPWWYAPLFASTIASCIDTAIFWSIAFYGQDMPLLTLALGDLGVKLALDLALLTPFRLAVRSLKRVF